MFGSDFFKVFYFIIELLKLVGKCFGNGEDEQGFEEVLSKTNGKSKPKDYVASETRNSNA